MMRPTPRLTCRAYRAVGSVRVAEHALGPVVVGLGGCRVPQLVLGHRALQVRPHPVGLLLDAAGQVLAGQQQVGLAEVRLRPVLQVANAQRSRAPKRSL